MVDINAMSAHQVEWNMAALLNMELSRLRSNSNTYFIAGKYREAIDTLIAMKMSGIHAFSPEERKKLKDMEADLLISTMNVTGISSFNPELNKKAAEGIKKIRKIFPEYNEVLMDALHKHGFLGSYKKDGSIMNI